MLDVGRRTARLICVMALLAVMALTAYTPPWDEPAACAARGQTECLATGPDGREVLVTLGDDGRLRAEERNHLQEHARTLQLGLLLVSVGGLLFWRPRLLSRATA